MAPAHEDSASSGDEDAPESVSLAQSKRNIKKHDDALKKAHAAEKAKKKLKNQERDRKLKEQAESSKRRREEFEGDAELQARMERAMQEAVAELDGDDGSGKDGDATDEEDEEFKGIDVDSDEYSGEGSNGFGDEDFDEEMDSDEGAVVKSNPNHLPDHLFATAFASTTPKATSKRKANQDPPTRKARKRAQTSATPKDVLIGSRTIRTLAPGAVAGASTLPSAKVRKFLDRSLGLKGPSAKKRGWERRPGESSSYYTRIGIDVLLGM
ncbi:hypothetical protein H0H87_000510 [Tephrocybe sp. NHM501043]|nr:hypothetical protein H0H87_000510 [Tephrocybe sp. NHM501043]